MGLLVRLQQRLRRVRLVARVPFTNLKTPKHRPGAPLGLPPRERWLELPVRRAPRLYTSWLDGRPFAHDPDGYDSLAVLTPPAWQLSLAADGRALGEVLADLAQPHEHEAFLSELPLLWQNGFVRSPGIQPRAPKGTSERVFNTWIHLTNACNLACPYCYIHKDKRHMADHVVSDVLASIATTAQSGQVDRIHVRYAGGEPMLRFAAMQAFHAQATELCAQHGVKFSAAVLTNGAVVPDGAIDWLKAHKVSISMSIDGVGAMQDVMRPVVGGGSSFARVQQGLDRYQQAGIQPYMLITVGDSNLDGLPELTEFLLNRGLGFRYSLVRDLEWGASVLDDRHGPEHADGRQAAPTDILSGEPLFRLQKVLGQCYRRIEQHVRASDGADPSWFRRTHRFCDLDLWRPLQHACGAGRTYVAIGEDGQVSPCQAALHHPGTQPVAGLSLLQLAKGQTQFPLFTRTHGNPDCARCQHKPSCAGGCPLQLYRREGHVDGRSPYCMVYKAVIPQMVRIAALELMQAQRRS